jgi:uncharacterized membrane protein YhaH (DUF805 family)
MTANTVYTILGICFLFLLLTLWAILDASRRDFGAIEKKAAWVFVSAIPFIGFIIYLVFGIRRGKKPS